VSWQLLYFIPPLGAIAFIILKHVWTVWRNPRSFLRDLLPDLDGAPELWGIALVMAVIAWPIAMVGYLFMVITDWLGSHWTKRPGKRKL
jgi:hypothetical protein